MIIRIFQNLRFLIENIRESFSIIIGLHFIIFIINVNIYTSTAWSASFKKIVIQQDYNHTKYAPTCNNIQKDFRAFTTCFDNEDDDNNDGTPDKWAIPHWVSYEIKKYPGQLPKGPKRPSKWITIPELFQKGIAPKDASYHFSEDFREQNPEHPQLGYDRGHMCMKNHAWRLGRNAD